MSFREYANRNDGRANVTPTVVRAFDLYGQATKGAWGMSWHQEALKGVEDCEKLG